jgi:TonB family protein
MTAAAPPPAAAAAAPPPTIAAAFDFSDGAKAVQSDATADPAKVYKGFLEFTIKQKWVRPDNIEDKGFVAEVELALDKSGQVIGNQWKRSSGHKQWDDSVRKALAQTKAVSRPPPKGFPEKFLVRFDVESEPEPLMSASLR